MYPNDSVFRKYKAYADIRGVPLVGGVKWQWLCRHGIFGELGGYFFGNVRDKNSNITLRYATPCLPVIDCKMNDLEWPWVDISRQNPFSTSKTVARLPLRQLGFLVVNAKSLSFDKTYFKRVIFITKWEKNVEL